jgi:3-phosphoshikimate 1-carboxyvinyltransferase
MDRRKSGFYEKAVKMRTVRVRKVNAEIKAPPSKSYTNRALLISALAEGETVLKNALISDDTKFMKKALVRMGVSIREKGSELVVNGRGGKLKPAEIYVGNAGTAMRFLTGAATLAEGNVVLDGNDRMRQRPIKDLVEGLRGLGASISCTRGCPPVMLSGGGLKGGEVNIKGDKSSQYFSSIMMVAPYAKEDTEIKVDGSLTSIPYVDITMDIMDKFGVSIENDNYRSFKIKAGQTYKAIKYEVEGDASSASYFFGAAAITSGKVRVKGLNPDSAQGDIHFPEILREMGCKVEKDGKSITVRGGKLKGVNVDMNRMPDTVQTLAVVALFAKGKTVIKNISNLRIKETDRIKALAAELRKLGAGVEEGADSLTITPKEEYRAAEIEPYDDHRMAMSFGMAGLRIAGIKIKNEGCVSKSFPGFWEELDKI